MTFYKNIFIIFCLFVINLLLLDNNVTVNYILFILTDIQLIFKYELFKIINFFIVIICSTHLVAYVYGALPIIFVLDVFLFIVYLVRFFNLIKQKIN